jgi:LCP family protein required for cell wall assembly
VLGAVLLAPHVVFGYYDLVQYNLLTSVFGGNEAQNSTTTTTTGNGPTSSTLPGETTTTSETTVVTGPQIWNGLDRLNILLLGGDFGAGRTGVRTDTMITVSIDPESGDVAMFSVPRNWTYAPLPDGMGIWDCNCYPELMNELWVAGEQHPEAFPGTGTPSENAVKGINSAFLGIPIHYYALVNLDGFVDIIDSIGGVDIYVPEQVIDEEYPHEDGTVERIQIDAGTQHLDGHLALAYARTRHQDSDYFRMNRQRCVLEAVLDQTEPTDLILNFQTIADVIKRSMQTDIPLDALPELVKLLPNIDRDEILSIAFIPPEYHLSFRPDGKPGRVPNVDLVQEHVRLIIDDPARAIQELGLDTLDDTCGTDGA